MFEQESLPLEVSIPNEAGWQKKSLEELCSLISRGTAPVYVEGSSVLAIGQRCVTTSRFAPEFARPHADRAMRNVLRPKSGDVLLNSTGAGTIGRSVVFDHDGAFIVDGHVTVFRPRTEAADGRWLNAVLRTSWWQSHLERFCYVGSTNQLELSSKPVKASALPVPSVQEQQRIAQILDIFYTAILETETLIDKLKAVKKGLLHDLLTRGIDATGQLRPPQIEAPQLYKESPLGWVPKEWTVAGLASAVRKDRSVIRTGPFGSSLKGEHWRESGRPVVTIGSLGDGAFIESELLFIDEKTAKQLVDFELCTGDIAFSRVADVGRSVVITEEQRGWIMSSNFMRISVDSEKVRPRLLQLLLASSILVRKQIRMTVNSAGRDVANSAVLMALRFPWPMPEEQDQIIEKVESFERKIAMEEAQHQKLLATKEGLIDDLLSGRVRVTSRLNAAPIVHQPVGQGQLYPPGRFHIHSK